MNKSFLFDMDGVLINSEPEWDSFEEAFLIDLFGVEIYKKVKDMLYGGSTAEFYKIAVENGFSMPLSEYYKRYDEKAEGVYTKAVVTDRTGDLISILQQKGFKIGLVSSSRMYWIECALKHMPFREAFEYVVSVNDREDLNAKPAPDGYIDAMKQLGSTPQTTIILEDSNTGLKAARSSGAFTIGLRQHVGKDYQQTGAHMYVETVDDLIRLAYFFS